MLWVAIIVVVVIIVLLLWWWLSRCPEEPASTTYQPPRAPAEAAPPAVLRGEVAVPEAAAPVAEVVAEAQPVEVEVPAPTAALAAEAPAIDVELPAPVAEVAAEPPPVAPDDLKVIEGIGPKISAMLQAQGIRTFAQLAATDVERLRGIMLAANLRIADPTTWPQQAALAAAGQWDELQTLQDSLKGGRKA